MRIKLKDAFELQIGKTPSRNKSEYWNGVYKWVSISDIGNSRKYVYSTRESITDKGIIDSGIKVIPKGTVIMSFKLSIGKTAITTEDMYTNEAIVAFIDKKKIPIDIDYLYYLCSGSNWMQGVNKAVMGLTLNKATLSEKEINIPNIEIQKKCAGNLDKIDRIIDLKKQQLDQLDLLVRSLFIEMFGDPIKNEKDWRINKFRDICTVRQGLQIPISKRLLYKEDNCYEYITVAYLHGSKEREYIKNPKETVICNKEDILMTRTGNTGMVITGVHGVFHNNFFLIDFDRYKFDKCFLVEYLNLELIQLDIMRRAGSSTIPDLNHDEFYKINVYVPPLDLQKRFAEYVSSIDKSKLAVKKSLEELEILKKSLMQKYFA